MITLEEIISSNLQMLNEQEKEILKALEFVRKAKSLFQGQNPSAPRNRIRALRKTVGSKTSAQKTIPPAGTKALRKDTHIARIMEILNSKNGQSTGDIAQKLFSKQNKEKDFPTFRQNIYNVISQSKKRKLLKSKDNKIYLP